MANELKLNLKMSFDSGTGITDSMVGADDFYGDFDTDQFRRGSQLIGTSEEEINFDAAGIIEGNKYLFFVNRSTSYNIEIRAASGEGAIIELRPGEVAAFEENGDTVPYAVAVGGSAMLEFCVLGGNT